MNWFSDFLFSTIGRKVVMALTGLFLISFLIVHVGVNSLLFVNDDGELFNKGANFMETNLLIRAIEYLLFAGFIIHIAQSVVITKKNRKARPVKYGMNNGNANSKWYSRNMGILGALIFVFLVIHLRDFFYELRFTDEIPLRNGVPNLYLEVKEVFEMPLYAIIYIISMLVLAFHLLHGFQSAFRSLGLMHKKYTPLIQWLGKAYTYIVCGLFILMPLYFLIKKMIA